MQLALKSLTIARLSLQVLLGHAAPLALLDRAARLAVLAPLAPLGCLGSLERKARLEMSGRPA